MVLNKYYYTTGEAPESGSVRDCLLDPFISRN